METRKAIRLTTDVKVKIPISFRLRVKAECFYASLSRTAERLRELSLCRTFLFFISQIRIKNLARRQEAEGKRIDRRRSAACCKQVLKTYDSLKTAQEKEYFAEMIAFKVGVVQRMNNLDTEGTDRILAGIRNIRKNNVGDIRNENDSNL